MTPEKAREILDANERYFRKEGRCLIWTGTRHTGRYKSAQPYCHHEKSGYRVRRLKWIEAGRPTHGHQSHNSTCGTPWCVSLDHIKVNSEESKGVIMKREVAERREERKRVQEAQAKLKCVDCGRPRTRHSVSRCGVCARSMHSRVFHRATGNSTMSAAHIRAAYRARELRLGRRKAT